MTVQEKKVVLITDVFSSVGLATAILLSRSGHEIFGAVADRSTAPDTPYLSPVELDIRRDESVTHAIADVLQEAGRIDVLVNNAKISVVGGLEETSISQSCEVFETNFFGALRVTYDPSAYAPPRRGPDPKHFVGSRYPAGPVYWNLCGVAIRTRRMVDDS